MWSLTSIQSIIPYPCKKPMKINSFTKEERLCSQKQISLLFSSGSSFVLYPFRFVWIEETSSKSTQVVISVSKKKFRKAVDRNKIKRLIREAYRKNKAENLYPSLKERGLRLDLMIIYIGNEIITAEAIEKKLNLGLKRLLKEDVKSS